jgi:hypothetical protein
MKVTLIHNADGSIAGFSHSSSPIKQEVTAGLRAGPNQRLQEVDLPDEFASITDGKELHKKIQEHLKKK